MRRAARAAIGGGGLVLCGALLAACGGEEVPPPPEEPPPPGDVEPVLDATELPLDLGHVDPIRALQRAGDRALSLDASGHWVLWDVAARRAIARGDACDACPVFLRGETMAARNAGNLEVRSAATGDLRAVIVTDAKDAKSVGLSSDGAYVWAATATHLRAWSTLGAMLVDISGNYAAGDVFASPAELRVARGPAGAATIEAIRIADGDRSTAGFAGTFQSWFSDGERFLTLAGDVVGVHAKDGAQLTQAEFLFGTRFVGQGSYAWTASGDSVRIFAAGDLSAPVHVYPLPPGASVFSSGDQIGIYHAASAGPVLELLTLGSSVSQSGPIPLPFAGLAAFGGDPGGWLIGSYEGVVFDSAAVLGPPAARRSLTLGRAWDIRGAPDGTAVIATASGRSEVLVLGPTEAVVSHELPIAGRHIELSPDASLLVVAEEPSRDLRVVRVADGAELYAWPNLRPDGTHFVSFSWAREALVLSHLLAWWETPMPWRLTTITGTELPSYGPGSLGTADVQPSRLSPRGTNAAFMLGIALSGSSLEIVNAKTQIYANGVLTGTVMGAPLAWIDDDHLLVATYREERILTSVFAVQDQAFLYDAASAQGVLVPLPKVGSPLGRPELVTPLGGTLLYAQTGNRVIDYATGATTWRGDPLVMDGVVVGSDILFTRGPRLFRAAFR